MFLFSSEVGKLGATLLGCKKLEKNKKRESEREDRPGDEFSSRL